MFNTHDISRNACQLFGKQATCGYDWWWHSFTARHAETGEEKAFFIEFFVCNPALAENQPVFGQLPENKKNGKRPSYVMVKVGCWGANATQLHRFYSWDDARVDMHVPFGIVTDDCYLSEWETRGHVAITKKDAEAHPEWMSDAGEMSWSLRIDKRIAFNVGYGASSPMRKMQLFEMFWHAEGMKTEYAGNVIWNGEKYIVTPDTCYGYADKNWGKGFTTPWVWLSSCHLVSEKTGEKLTNSVFDIGGGRPKIACFTLNRKLLSAFWYQGKPYEFNFSKFWTFCRTKFNCYETKDEVVWHVDQRTWGKHMVTDITCKKADMLLINYEAPNGEKRHKRLWNGGTGEGTVSLYRHHKLVDTIHAYNVGCEYGEYDVVDAYKKKKHFW